MEPAEVGLYLGDSYTVSSEIYGENPYHHVVCMVVYVCHTTATFHMKFAEKLKELDERYGGLEVFNPSCGPDPAHVVYMVNYLEKLNPGAELLFGTDSFDFFDRASKARFSLFVVTSKWGGTIRGRKGSGETDEAPEETSSGGPGEPGLGELMAELIRMEEELRLEREKVKALEEKEIFRLKREKIDREAKRTKRSETSKKAYAAKKAAEAEKAASEEAVIEGSVPTKVTGADEAAEAEKAALEEAFPEESVAKKAPAKGARAKGTRTSKTRTLGGR